MQPDLSVTCCPWVQTGACRERSEARGRGEKTVHRLEHDAYWPLIKFNVEMPDARKIRNRVLLRLAGHPLVIGPFIAGMTALTAVWSFDWRAGFALFAGLEIGRASCRERV